MRHVSEQIADWLVQQGIEQVFCVTGGGAMYLNQAFGAHESLRCTYMHHEQACAMAAEGYARIKGKPAVVLTTTGPGAINALNGVYGAFTDSIPMIVISGQVKRETCVDFHDAPLLRQLGDQEGPTIAMASPVCKWARLVREPKNLQTMLAEAFDEATSGRPGPVWLDIPLDIQSDMTPLEIAAPKLASAQAPAPATVSACERMVEKLRNAHRPLLLGGTGVRLAHVTERVLALAQRLGIPYATAWTHDLIASDHPLFAGRPGTIGTRAGNFCLQSADLVIVLGSRLNIRQTSYNWTAFAKQAFLVQVDIDAAELSKPTIQPDLAIHCGLPEFIAAFESALAGHVLPDYADWANWCRAIGQQFDLSREHPQINEMPLNPYHVVDRIFANLRQDDIIACGNASACILPFQIGKLRSLQRMFSNSGSASMGYDLPAAIGAALAAIDEKRRVICFAGDGSLQMNVQELQTLKTLGANVIIVVLNNGGYLSIWQTHENFFGRVVGATPESGVEFPDFVAVARAYGIAAASIRQRSDLARLDELLAADGPLLIDIVVDPRQGFAPRIKSRLSADGKFITPELHDMYPFLDASVVQSVCQSALAIRSRPRALAQDGAP